MNGLGHVVIELGGDVSEDWSKRSTDRGYMRRSVVLQLVEETVLPHCKYRNMSSSFPPIHFACSSSCCRHTGECSYIYGQSSMRLWSTSNQKHSTLNPDRIYLARHSCWCRKHVLEVSARCYSPRMSEEANSVLVLALLLRSLTQ